MPMSQTQSDGSSPSCREKRAKRGPRCLRIWSLSPLRHFQMHLLVLLGPRIICDAANEAALPPTDEIVTQILPVRFVEASQLVKDLQPLISIQTTMTANESANSIVLTDTQANIHRIARIIQAIDSNAEDFTAVRVFHLKNAIP